MMSESTEVIRALQQQWTETIDQTLLAVVVIHVRETIAFEKSKRNNSEATGFVVDAQRGIILTNKHVITSGPITADATFSSKEEVSLIPLYRDPVHDFGFFKFDPSLIKQQKLRQIELHPEGAAVGTEVRVIGNDGGEKQVILPGVLAKMDREPPKYDFNTFYYTSANNTSGGSSGSPVVTIDGRAIALNSGGKLMESTSIFLPIDGAKRALRIIQNLWESNISEQRPFEVPRGDLYVTFQYQSFSEARRLGVTDETVQLMCGMGNEKSGSDVASKQVHKGMLVVDKILKFSSLEGVVNPLAVGDVLISIDGKTCSQYYSLEEVLNENVGNTVSLTIQRGNQLMVVSALVHNLEDVCPKRLFQFYGCVAHALTYSCAMEYGSEIDRGVYIAEAGTLFQRDHLHSRYIIISVDGTDIRTLDDFISAMERLEDDSKVMIRFFLRWRTSYEYDQQLQLDKTWFPKSCIYVRNDSTGLWDKSQPAPLNVVDRESKAAASDLLFSDNLNAVNLKENEYKKRSQAKSRQSFSSQLLQRISNQFLRMYCRFNGKGFSFQELSSCICDVSFTAPRQYKGSTVVGDILEGTGVVVDAERGLILVSRAAVPHAYGSVRFQFWNSGFIPAKVVFIHPTQFYSLIGYDTQHPEFKISGVTVRSARIRRQPISVSNKIAFGGYKAGKFEASMISAGGYTSLLQGHNHAKIVATGLNVIEAPQLLCDGVLCQQGEVVGLSTVLREIDETTMKVIYSGLLLSSVADVIGSAGCNSSTSLPTHMFKFPCHLTSCPLFTAITMGLTEDLTTRVRQRFKAEVNLRQTTPELLKIHMVTPRSSAENILQLSDVIITINNKIIVCMQDIHDAVRDASVKNPTGSSPSSSSLNRQLSAETGLVELVVLRKGLIETLVPFQLQKVPTMFNHISALWAGLMLETIDDFFLDYLGFNPLPQVNPDKPGIWVGHFKRGSPAARYKVFTAPCILFQVNDISVGSIEEFLDVVKEFSHETAVRLHFLLRNRVVHVATLRTDVIYWPTEVTKRMDNGSWENSICNF